MNTLLKKSILVALAAAGAHTVYGDPPAAPAKPAPARSVFVMPASTHDGRDPFFPESTRPYEDNPATKHVLDESSFTIKGFSFEHGHAMVIINNHTFAVGDEGDVLTGNGRVHLRLDEIRPDAVVIEVNGTKHEIKIPAK